MLLDVMCFQIGAGLNDSIVHASSRSLDRYTYPAPKPFYIPIPAFSCHVPGFACLTTSNLSYCLYKKTARRCFSASISFISHCQSVRQRYPKFSRATVFRLSRSLLPAILARQNSVLVAGIVARLQPSCPCQKQPWTKITALCRGKTISGLPKSFFTCSRNRYPILCKRERTSISGLVFLPFTWAMLRLRFSKPTLSIEVIYAGKFYFAKTHENEKAAQKHWHTVNNA